VSSLRDESIPLVGRRFWVHPSSSGSGGFDDEAFNATFVDLEASFEPGGPGPVGVCVLLEDREEMERRPEAIWPGTKLMFAGYLADERQLRIRYFPGATIGPGLPDSPSLEEAIGQEYPLEDRYRIEPLSESAAVSHEDVLRLWEREGVLPGPMARQRVQQVHLVAITAEGELAGVSTIYLERNPQLRMSLWYYRTFVAPSHRQTNVARHLIARNRDLLEERFVSGKDTGAQGIVFELENVGLQRHLNTAHWPYSDFTFIGEDHRGWHLRVHYFPGAVVPLPAQTPTG
jgi:hypothetical protein